MGLWANDGGSAATTILTRGSLRGNAQQFILARGVERWTLTPRARKSTLSSRSSESPQSNAGECVEQRGGLFGYAALAIGFCHSLG